MSATMLSLIAQATGELGSITVPTFVAGNTDNDAIQQLALLNAVGYELMEQYAWQQIVTEYRFTTAYTATTGTVTSGSAVVTGIPSTTGLSTSYMVLAAGVPTDTYIQSVDSATQVTLTQAATASGTAETINFCKTKYAFPSDYNRSIGATDWDKTKHWRMRGPLTAQQWQYVKSGIISTGPRISFRRLGGTYQTWPPVASAEYIGFEYVSSNWALDTTGAAKSSLTVDTDTCIFPDRLMVLGLKLKFLQSKNLETAAAQSDYNMHLSIAKASDSGLSELSMSPRPTAVLLGQNQLPDAGFGA